MEYIILASMGFFAALTPGPDIFYILKQTLCNGVKVGLIVVFGILIGNIIYLSLVGFGLGVIGQNPYFQAIVGFFGSLYLLKISYLTFKDKPHFEKSCTNKKSISLIQEALLLNLSNPKAIIFFTVVITPFLTKNILFSLSSLFIGIASAFLIAIFLSSKITIDDDRLIIINKIASIIFLFFAILLFKTAILAIQI